MSQQYESLTVEVNDHVAQVTLIGPGKGNAMGPAFWTEMPVAFGELDADPDVRAIVLTGSGRNFSYGLDLVAMGDTIGGAMSGEVSARPRVEFHGKLKRMQQSITAVADCRTPRRSPPSTAGASAAASTSSVRWTSATPAPTPSSLCARSSCPSSPTWAAWPGCPTSCPTGIFASWR